MTRANISWDSIEKKLQRGAIRNRTARRWIERALRAKIKADRRKQQQQTVDTDKNTETEES